MAHKSEIDKLKTALPATTEQNSTLEGNLTSARGQLDKKDKEIADYMIFRTD